MDSVPSIPWLAPWAHDRHPTDVSRRHVVEITEGESTYTVTQGGTMDGESCRVPHGSWEPGIQTWESNRAVRMENTGETDLVDPWLSNGRNDFRTRSRIVAGAIRAGMSDAERALALYWTEVTHRFHCHTGDEEGADVVKMFNIYGFTTCGHDAVCMAALWKEAGFARRPGPAMGHVITQVYYHGAWHLMDADMQCLYLRRDNHTVAGVEEVSHDHDLVKRTHAEGLTRPDARVGNEWEAGLFVHDAEAQGTREPRGEHTMAMRLRPGEALTWRWGQHVPPKYHGRDDIERYFGQAHAATICNGLWEYRPDLRRDLWRAGADVATNITSGPDGLAAGRAGDEGEVVWTVASPYVFVGGHLQAEGHGARFYLSWDSASWTEVADAHMDPFFPRDGPPRYRYQLKCVLAGGASLRSLAIVNDLQMAPLALPGMVIGENQLRYTDASKGARTVRITHEWVERSAARPPAAPARPLAPSHGGETDGTDIVFRWEASPDAGDYFFELSEYADMRWPLSSNFRKIISLTADRGEARYTLPLVGLLAPDRPYYWRVRAWNTAGVWGPWSAVWCFTPRGASPPIDVRLTWDEQRRVGTLRWKPNPAGRPPVRYRVYGSDEKGFSVSDQPYPVLDFYAGDWRNARLGGRFPANFVCETDATALDVVGEGLALPNANKAYYRVVAVDAHGKRSWSSEYAEAPRPFVTTSPVRQATAGKAYRYELASIRSLGALGYRPVTPEQVPEFWPPEEREAILTGFPWNRQVERFWDAEETRFAIVQGPSWLAVDPTTGLLQGTPDTPGRARVDVEVTLRRTVDDLDPEALAWGGRRVIATRTVTLGPARQSFVIEVRA